MYVQQVHKCRYIILKIELYMVYIISIDYTPYISKDTLWQHVVQKHTLCFRQQK